MSLFFKPVGKRRKNRFHLTYCLILIGIDERQQTFSESYDVPM